MNEIRNEKILNAIIGFILFFVILFSGFLLINNIFSIEVKAQTNDFDANLASPDLQDKEYLGNGVYRLYNINSNIIDYNAITGIFTLNKTTLNPIVYKLYTLDTSQEYTIQIEYISKENESFELRYFINGGYQYNFLNTFISNTSDLFIGTHQSENNNGITQFKLQLEQGTAATDYQVPIGALEQHVQLEKGIGYYDGYDDGYYNGWLEGYDLGLNEAFDQNNLMPIAEKKLKGTLGPRLEFFGFRIPINKKVKQITILNLYDYLLKDLDWVGSGVKQGLGIHYDDYVYDTIFFDSQYDEFKEIMEFTLDKDDIVEYIDIVLALPHAEVPPYEVDNMLDHMANNLGFYINNKILNDDAINRFKEIIEYDLRNILEIEYQNNLDTLLDFEYKKGYDKGIDENMETGGFGMLLGSAFTAVGTLLSIELLPNISIGALVAIPVVFGVVMFIIGRRKE